MYIVSVHNLMYTLFMGNEEKIQYLLDQIVELVHPKEVVLFGSNARGEASPGSDIDILVVIADGGHRRNTSKLIYRSIDSKGIAFDVLVATESDLINHKDNLGLIYKTILEEGRVLYAA